MKLFSTSEEELQQITERYAGFVQAGLRLAAWTIAALAGLTAAMLAVKLLWSLLMLGLRWIAAI